MQRDKELLLLEENFRCTGKAFLFFLAEAVFLFVFPQAELHTLINILGVLAKWHGVLAKWHGVLAKWHPFARRLARVSRECDSREVVCSQKPLEAFENGRRRKGEGHHIFVESSPFCRRCERRRRSRGASDCGTQRTGTGRANQLMKSQLGDGQQQSRVAGMAMGSTRGFYGQWLFVAITFFANEFLFWFAWKSGRMQCPFKGFFACHLFSGHIWQKAHGSGIHPQQQPTAFGS